MERSRQAGRAGAVSSPEEATSVLTPAGSLVLVALVAESLATRDMNTSPHEGTG